MRTPILVPTFAAMVALAGAAQAQQVGGSYTVSGKNFDGSAYSGTARITPSGGACRIVWQTGPTNSSGICMLAGKSFAAAYKLGNEIGLVVYELQPDGRLVGTWTIADRNGSGSETLTPRR
jgi:hypothetical protein